MSTNTFAITPTDSTPVVGSPGGSVGEIYVGVAGNLALSFGADTTSTVFLSVPIGWFKCPELATIVWATGTTATNLVGINRLTNSF